MYNYTEQSADQCEFISVAGEDELADGERLFLEIDELEIVLFKISGKIFAIEDICSHDDGPLGDGNLNEYEVVCPRHGARFDVRTGEVKTLPAIVPIPKFEVKVEGDDVLVEVD